MVGVAAVAAGGVVAGMAASSLLGGHPRSRVAGSRTCVYTGESVGQLAKVDRLLGADLRCVVVFNTQAPGWSAWEHPWFLDPTPSDAAWAVWRRDHHGATLVLTVPLVPAAPERDWRVAGASGRYDAHVRALVGNLVAAGLGQCVVRLGAEMNGTWNVDQAGSSVQDQGQWAAYWRHFVQVARSVPHEHLTFDWTVDSVVRPIPLNSIYPGDDVVDVVGIDQYDGDVTGHLGDAAARWAFFLNSPDGLAEVAAFSRSHGKPLSVPEWGLGDGSRLSAEDDDPYFVAHLVDWFRRWRVAYEGFWFPPRIEPDTATPRAWSLYRDFVREGG